MWCGGACVLLRGISETWKIGGSTNAGKYIDQMNKVAEINANAILVMAVVGGRAADGSSTIWKCGTSAYLGVVCASACCAFICASVG